MALTAQGLTLKVHPGNGAALLTFDVDESLRDDLAGFAVTCRPPTGDAFSLYNRLTFDQPIH